MPTREIAFGESVEKLTDDPKEKKCRERPGEKNRASLFADQRLTFEFGLESDVEAEVLGRPTIHRKRDPLEQHAHR